MSNNYPKNRSCVGSQHRKESMADIELETLPGYPIIWRFTDDDNHVTEVKCRTWFEARHEIQRLLGRALSQAELDKIERGN